MTKKKEVSVPTKLVVERSVKLRKGKESEKAEKAEEQVIEVHSFATTPAMVVVEIPVRMSKNFQSIGIKVGVHRPCYAEEIDPATDEALAWCFERIQKEIPDLVKALDGLA